MPILALANKVFGEGKSWKALQDIGAQIVRSRITDGSGRRDLFHYLVSAIPDPCGKQLADNMLIVIYT